MILLYARGDDSQVSLINRFPSRFGSIMTPRNSKSYLDKCTGVIGVDNDCFTGFHEAAFLRTLEQATKYRNHIRFVSAPDVVANAEKTLEWFNFWQPIIAGDYRLPVALVLQNGMTTKNIPLDRCDAVFVGGCSNWKVGIEAAEIVKEAKLRGLWTHAGRVSSKERIRYFAHLGINSIDSTAFNRWATKNLNLYDKWTRQNVFVWS